MLSRRDVMMAGLVAAASPAHAAAPNIKLGVLPFGTVSWEAETIRAAGLDAANGFTLETVKTAGNEAARIAFQGAAVDMIVSDLLWAARLRAEGRPVQFLPFSATEGAVMVPANSPLRSVTDLAGRRIGIAGGALDKSWLLLKAHARDVAGLDLAAAASPAFGAPPLLQQKLEAGELDAALLYWNFAARLEAKGYRRLLGVEDILRSFGLSGEVALLGYVFDESLAPRSPGLVEGFARASKLAKDLLATQDDAWATIRPLMAADDDQVFRALKQAFLAGIPRREVTAERRDAERLYAILARLGGEALVGRAQALPVGLYWGEERRA
jgi:NitT/TauT family transport system substrate-binding protein